jgi:hypothetical protein
MKTITSPWKSDFLELVSNSKKSIKITSPFVKENICDEMLSAKQTNAKLELITSFKLGNIYSGSLDIAAIEKIINQNGIVKNYSKLHSKIYLFDDKEVIISSGNLTYGGLVNNYEYGIYSNDKDLVSKISSDFNLLSKNSRTGKLDISHLEKVKEIISKIPLTESINFPNFKIESPENNYDTIEIPDNTISSSLRGWKLEVFKCINLIPNQIFTLNEINKFESQLKIVYPNNDHITDKIRQQLQYLRDLGLIEFLGNGHYRKLWK